VYVLVLRFIANVEAPPLIGCVTRAVFTNILSNGDLERLADADEHEVVREVQVYVPPPPPPPPPPMHCLSQA
jgi:hypothetical protein